MTPTPQTRNVREPFYGNGSAQSPNLCGGGDAPNIDKHEDFSTLKMTMLRGPGAVDTRVLFSPRGHGSKDTGRGPAICTTADIGERFSIFNNLL